MEFYEIVNKTIRLMECVLISVVIGLYAAVSYVSVFRDRAVLPSYLIVTSFAHYIVVLTKSPGSLLDLGNASVVGLCGICNRIRGSRTRHCHICSKCYNRRDHHCMLLGRCVAENNMRGFYFCILFLIAFLATWFFTKDCKAVVGIVASGALGSLLWLSLCIAHDKTSSEMMRLENKRVGMRQVQNLLKYVGDDPLGTFLPIVNTRKRAAC